MRKLRMGLAALVALAGAAALAAPNVLIKLDAADYDSLSKTWQNKGTLGGEFRPVGNGNGITFDSDVAGTGVAAVSLNRSNDSVMTNMVSPNVVCGTNPWAWEVWAYKPQHDGSMDVLFTWTGRNQWSQISPLEGCCMEFRWGTDNNNAVERYGAAQNLRWNALNPLNVYPPAGQWFHIAATRDASGVERLYVNGVMRDRRFPVPAAIRDDVGYFTLGAVRNMDNNNWDNPWRGSIASLRVYDGPLAMEEVVASYMAQRVAFGQAEIPTDTFWRGTPGVWEDWNSPADWSGLAVPDDNDAVFIENGGMVDHYSDTKVFKNFQGYSGGLRMDRGTLTVLDTVNGAVFLGYQPGQAFDLELKGGTFELPRGTQFRDLSIGRDGGTARVVVGGTSEQAWLHADREIYVAMYGGSQGHLTILPNGFVTVASSHFYIAANGNTSTTGEVVVAGGTLLSRARIILSHGQGAQARLIVNSGSAEAWNELVLTENNQDASNLAEAFLNGGLTWVQRVAANGGSRTYIYLNGGMLRNRDGNPRNDFLQGLTGAYVQSGGACFDVIAGTTIGINQPLLADPNDPGGGLTKTGPGGLNLYGDNTFTGRVTVAEGQLYFRTAESLPDLAPGSILVQKGAVVGYDIDGGAALLLPLIDPASEGSISLFGRVTEDIDLSQHPNLTFSVNGTYSGIYTPYTGASGKAYKFFVAGGSLNYPDPITDPGASVVLEAGSWGYLDMRGDNAYTNGTTINGAVLVVYHANALGVPPYPGARDIRIANGAGLLININVGQQGIDDFLSRITLDSQGAFLFNNDMRNFTYDLSAFPYLTLGAEAGRDFGGTLISHPGIGGYHVGGGMQAWNTDGLRFRNLGDDPGGASRKLVAQYQGTVTLADASNPFTGGIIASNSAALHLWSDLALGAEPPAFRADYLYLDNACLRSDPRNNINPLTTHPNRGMTIGEGGACFNPPGNKYTVWSGDLSGSGPITAQDSGIMIFGGAGNTWAGALTLNSNNDDGTFAVGYGPNFSWVKTNLILGAGMFGVATDLDITWSDKFELPLGNTPPLMHATPAGMDADVGLRKLGEGTLTLDTPNTYRRITRVEGGTLKVGHPNALPSGGGKGNLIVTKNMFFPALSGATLDLNGFDVNVNGFNGGGLVTNAALNAATLTIGNNNQGGTFAGTIDPGVKVFKAGNNTQTFHPGVSMGDFTLDRGPTVAAAGTSFRDIELRMVNTADSTAFNVGLSVNSLYGLTGEYYNFDADGARLVVAPGKLSDLDTFEALLAPYAPAYVESSSSFGEGFDAGDTGANRPGSKFQGNYNGRNYHFGYWTGEFYAEESGEYSFATLSDDGCAVYINRQPVVIKDSDGGYLVGLAFGTITLAQGWHDIVIGHYQGTGDRGLTVFMAPPGATPLTALSDLVEGDPQVPIASAVLPQRLLRPYPVSIRSLSGISGSRVDIRTNTTLIVTGETSGSYMGRLTATAEDACLIKEGAGTQTFAWQTIPEFNGQIIVNDGTLGLQGATPFMQPVSIKAGAALAAFAPAENISNRGMKGTYYNGNYQEGNNTTTVQLESHFNGAGTPTLIAYTTQTGVLAVADSEFFNYQNGVYFPSQYASGTVPLGDKSNFRARYQGRFIALEPGEYIFGIESDDRLDMYLNGERIIENSNSGTGKRASTNYLDAGTHDFQIGWGQGSGALCLQPYITQPGRTETRMPNALLRSAVSMISGWNGGGDIALPDTGSYLCAKIDTEQTLDVPMDGVPGSEFEKNGTGELTLLVDNDTFFGTWYVMLGTMIVGDGATSGSLGSAERVHVAKGAKLIFNRSDDILFTGLVTGGGEISSIGGSVTLCNIGDDFTGTFTSGLFFIEGNSALTPEAFAKGQGDGTLNLQMGDGTKLVLPPHDESDPERNPVTLGNVTLELQVGTTNAYFLDALMIQAGKEVKVEGLTGVTGLFGYYYKVDNRDPNWVKDQGHFNTFEDAEAFLQNYPLICKETTWTAGDTMDFAENGSRFPATVRALSPVEYWGTLWKGKFLVTEPGEYTFHTRSDDNSMLFIDNQLVVNNNGSHGMIDGYGTRTLAVGLHDFALAYYQGNGGYGLIVSVAPPGQSMQPPPNSMLYADPADCAGEDL
ncbi:MAG: PA14 domain-containing protein, partial [Kiritimatiellaeota bacterium]|nr:PA14 domain-containing protein [Kiritimatiellota bacterium]